MTVRAQRSDGWNRWRTAIWVTLAGLMLLPVAAKTASKDFAWTAFDFAFFAALLLGIGMVCELVARKTRNPAYLAGAGVAVVTACLLVVVTGAVGIIGTEDNDANLMYGAVLAVGIIGAIIARFRPRGMACALLAVALAQVVIAIIALIGDLGSDPDSTYPIDIVGVTALFAALWLLSAWLFQNAARDESPAPQVEPRLS